MFRGSFPFAGYTALLLLLLLLPSFSSQTALTTATKNHIKSESDCTVSCGNINISTPFRLKGDSEHCGDKRFELSCEPNGTTSTSTHHAVLYLFSGKYIVHAINYSIFTIRLVDAGVRSINGSRFSNPSYSLTRFNFTHTGAATYPILTPLRSRHIIFVSCENPMNHSNFLVETASCVDGISRNSSISSLGTHSYFMVQDWESSMGDFNWVIPRPNLFDLGTSCKITQMVFVSPSPSSYDYMMTSCEAIYNEIARGFELSWLDYACEGKCTATGEYCTLSSDFNGIMCSRDSPSPPEEHRWYMKIINYISQKLEEVIHPIYIYFHLEHFPLYTSHIYRYQLRLCAVVYSVLYTGARLLVGLPFLAALLIYKWRRRHLSMYEDIEEFLQSNKSLMPVRYSYSDIKKMARGFKDKLGQGGYGSVYKAKLRSGRLVAIKMLGKSSTNGQDFINEVATIGRIHHVNVVRLIGFCVEGSKRVLVYDFMPNGSLEKYIFSKEGGVVTTSLSCSQIFEIALGVARGVEYLHRGCEMQILHFDIKPHNILLDEKFTAKVSDFGLARLYPLDNSIVSLTAARGTIGYIAPEFFYKNIGGVSYKADVYSFGMLLMEMAGRRKNLNVATQQSSQFSQIYFPSWVSDQLSAGNAIEIGDNATEEEKETIKKMMMVALWCIQMKPSERPSMNKVVEMLEGEIDRIEMPPKPFLYPQQMQESQVQVVNLSSACGSNTAESPEISLIENAN